MELAFKIAAVGMVGTVLTVLLKKQSPDLSVLLAMAVCLVLMCAVTERVRDLLDFVRRVMQAGGLTAELFSPLMKTVGIAWISQTGANLCRDAGQAAIASAVELAGTIGAILAALPLFEAVWSMLQSLI